MHDSVILGGFKELGFKDTSFYSEWLPIIVSIKKFPQVHI